MDAFGHGCRIGFRFDSRPRYGVAGGDERWHALVLAGHEAEPLTTGSGEKLRLIDLDFDAEAAVSILAGFTPAKISPVFSEREVRTADVRLGLFDNTAVTLSGSEATLTTTTPYRTYPATATAAGSGTRFNAHVVSDIVQTAAGYKSPPVQGGGKFTPITPTRVLDTRAANGIGGYWTPWTAGETRVISVAGNAGVPAGATSVVLNITAVSPASGGYLTAWPYGSPIPATSTGNFATGVTKASTAIVSIGQYGLINIQSSAVTDGLVDVMGYFGGNAAATDRYAAVAPYRAYDSRASSPLAAGEKRTIGTGLPAGTTLAVLNITSTGLTANGFFAAGNGTGASILNYQTGVNIANLAFVPVISGNISLYSSAVSHAIIDVIGYFSASGTLQYTPIVQQRLTNYVPVYPGTAYDTAVAGVGGIPSSAQVVFNLTGNTAAAPTWMVSYASTAPIPPGSTVNITPGQANNNLSISALGADGKLRTYNAQALVYMYLDVSGYFS